MFIYKGCIRITLEFIRNIVITMMYQLTRSVGSIPQFGLKAIIYIAFIIVMIYPT